MFIRSNIRKLPVTTSAYPHFTPCCELLLSTIEDFHMDQLDTEPTRGTNILELIRSSCPETVTSCTTGPGVSDHDHLVIVRASVRAKQNTKKSRFIHFFPKCGLGKRQIIPQVS